jgi:glyceraldehyde-3-phosphate dehydrogenase (NADP+)
MQFVQILVFLSLCALGTAVQPDFIPIFKAPIQVEENSAAYARKPFVDGSKFFHGGIVREYGGKTAEMVSPIFDGATGKKTVIGRLAQMNGDDVSEVLKSAKAAWNNGRGVWPQMTANERIAAMERVVASLKQRRTEIVDVLMWEIGKTTDDAAAEFDRTMTFIDATIAAFRAMDASDGAWKVVSGILARVRRAAIGIMLCLGPFNYPFNETYATLIPALLAGNVVIMKIPNLGGLAHVITMEVYAQHLPAGAINFFSGSGRETMGPLMSTGDIDVLAFIGGSGAADAVIKAHPHPHRLKVFLQLEGKNLGIVLPDADLDTAVKQVTLGATSYNGQRCTAIKLVMVHRSIVDAFLDKFSQSVSSLKWGLPWEAGVSITPLPEPNKPQYLRDLLADAVAHGARVVNAAEGGGESHGALMRPAVVYPVTRAMRLWHEEQFGPVVPVAVYDDLEEVYDYLGAMPYGQQAAIFTSDAQASAPLLDVLSTVVGRVNINTQCGRSPDSLPFSARRSSAMGTMSVTEALRVFSTETVLAAKHDAANERILKGYEATSKFMEPLRATSDKSEL